MRLVVPAVLAVTVIATAECQPDENCNNTCVPKVYQDAGVPDGSAYTAASCPATPDDQGNCPAGCMVHYSFC